MIKKIKVSRKAIAILLTGVMTLSIIACSSPEDTSRVVEENRQESEKTVEMSDETVKIGLSAILTGAAAMEGEHVKNGVELAVKEKNEEGGLLGRPIELITLDDQKDNTVMVNVANNLVSQGVCSVIGPSTSSGGLAVSQVYIDAQIPFICEGSSPNLRKAVLEDGNEWMFLCRPNDYLQAQASAAYILQELDVDTVGMLYVNNDFGLGAMQVIKDELEKGGVTLKTEAYNAGDADVSGQILNLKNSGMQAFVFWADSDYVLVARQAYELGVDVPIISSPGATIAAQRDLCEPEWIEGYIIATDVDFASQEAYIADFVDAYMETYNIEVDLHASAGYTAAQLLFAAIEKAETDDPIAIRKALNTLEGVITPNDPKATVDDAHCFCHQSNIVEIDAEKTPVLKTTIRIEN